jgi:hypothetical protein
MLSPWGSVPLERGYKNECIQTVPHHDTVLEALEVRVGRLPRCLGCASDHRGLSLPVRRSTNSAITLPNLTQRTFISL